MAEARILWLLLPILALSGFNEAVSSEEPMSTECKEDWCWHTYCNPQGYVSAECQLMGDPYTPAETFPEEPPPADLQLAPIIIEEAPDPGDLLDGILPGNDAPAVENPPELDLENAEIDEKKLECLKLGAPLMPSGANPEDNARAVYELVLSRGAHQAYLSWRDAKGGEDVDTPEVPLGDWDYVLEGTQFDDAGNYNYTVTGYVLFRTSFNENGLSWIPDSAIYAILRGGSSYYQLTGGRIDIDLTVTGEDVDDVRALEDGFARGVELMKPYADERKRPNFRIECY